MVRRRLKIVKFPSNERCLRVVREKRNKSENIYAFAPFQEKSTSKESLLSSISMGSSGGGKVTLV